MRIKHDLWFTKYDNVYWLLFIYTYRNKSSVQSSTNKADGTPLFSLEPSGEEKDKFFVAKVWNFDYINKVLQQAEDQKLKELQEIVQGGWYQKFWIWGWG